MTELSPEAQDAVRKVEKLLRLAAKNPNEAEAAAAAAKAQELLTAYNLDMATVEQGTQAETKREDTQLRGGLYHYQRDLWKAVAQLNFCLYWNQYERVEKFKTIDMGDGTKAKLRRRGYQFQHRVVGRVVNTTATKIMAGYLEQTIERLTRERLHGDGSQFFTRWAISYREGMAERVIEKIHERRRKLLKEEENKRRDAEKAARAAGRKGVSTATTLTVSSFTKSEHDANIDFVYGEGTSAEWAADRAAQAKAAAEAEAEYAAWAKAHPEEARKQEEEERKRRRRAGYGPRSYKERKNVDYSGYYAGHEDGENISIDPQVRQSNQRRLAR